MDINKIEGDLGKLSADPNKALSEILNIVISNQAYIEVIISQQAIILAKLDDTDPKIIVSDMIAQAQVRIAEIRASIASKIGQ